MKKYNNKILIAVLVVLVAVLALSRIFRAPKMERNIRAQLTDVDTSAVTEVRVLRPGKEEIKLIRSKQSGAWQAVEANKKADADTVGVKDALRMACGIRINGLITRKKETWDVFNISDSSAIRVRLYVGDEKKADFMIGKIGFSQSKNGGMYTHVRLADEDEVYSTDGFLNPYFDKDFKNWRNKAVLRLNQKEITKIAFNYPDSGFVVEKRDSLWYVNNQLADSANTAMYLARLQNKDIADFDDTFSPKGAGLPKTIQIEGNGKVLAVLKAWPKKENEDWIISSSLQKGVYFRDEQGWAIKELFAEESTFSGQQTTSPVSDSSNN